MMRSHPWMGNTKMVILVLACYYDLTDCYGAERGLAGGATLHNARSVLA
jgi:hypothetical protein